MLYQNRTFFDLDLKTERDEASLMEMGYYCGNTQCVCGLCRWFSGDWAMSQSCLEGQYMDRLLRECVSCSMICHNSEMLTRCSEFCGKLRRRSPAHACEEQGLMTDCDVVWQWPGVVKPCPVSSTTRCWRSVCSAPSCVAVTRRPAQTHAGVSQSHPQNHTRSAPLPNTLEARFCPSFLFQDCQAVG